MRGSRAKVLFAATMALVLALGQPLSSLASVSPSEIPSSVLVAAGYADTERSVGTFHPDFPSPWCGSTGVQFIGSASDYNGNSTDPGNCLGGPWDGGAILVANAGANSVTLTNLTVTLPLPPSGSPGSPVCASDARPMTFNLWFGQQYYYHNSSRPAYFGGPITLLAGEEAIFTATTGNGTTCETGNYPSGPIGGTYDFDTSESNFLSGCTPTNDTASAPRITLSADGYATTTYEDLGHTLDTGGVDTGSCQATAANPEWPNESLGWRLINDTCGESCTGNQFSFSYSPPSTSTTNLHASIASRLPTWEVYAVNVVAVSLIAILAASILRDRRRKRAVDAK